MKQHLPVMMAAATAIASLASPAAAVDAIASDAYALKANLSIVGNLAVVTLGPDTEAAGGAPGAYDNTRQVASVNISQALGAAGLVTSGATLGTGLLTSNAVSAFPATPHGAATATVTALNTSLGTSTAVPFAPVISALLSSLTADAVVSNSQIDGNGALTAFGETTIVNLNALGTLIGKPLTFTGTLSSNVASQVNFQLLDAAGIRIVLNEQTLTGNGSDSLGIATNAIHIFFDNAAIGTGLLNGDVIVAHSDASIAGPAQLGGGGGAVPEADSWALLLAGFGTVGFAVRRRRATVRA